MALHAHILMLVVISVRVIQWGAEGQTDRVHIGAFNIKVLGLTKMGKPEVVAVLKKIIRRYDLVFIQEIRDISNTAIHELLDVVNYRLWNGRKYRMLLSPRLGRTSSKEAYAYMYREHKLDFLEFYVHDDVSDEFEREPAVVKFRSKVTALETFFIIGCHIKPSMAPEELEAMIPVYDHAVQRFGTNDGILMGDFNADCSYLNVGERASNKLKNDPRFNWLIDDDADTTVAASSCAYDRIIITGTQMTNAIVRRSAKVYNFTKVYGMTLDETADVSDHYPVEVKLK